MQQHTETAVSGALMVVAWSGHVEHELNDGRAFYNV